MPHRQRRQALPAPPVGGATQVARLQAAALHDTPTSQAIAFFSDLQNVTISGGSFTQVLTPGILRRQEDDESQFESVKWGHIHDLRLVGETEVVKLVTTRLGRVKTIVTGKCMVYHVKIFRSTQPFTMMSYKGGDFARWKEEAIQAQHVVYVRQSSLPSRSTDLAKLALPTFQNCSAPPIQAFSLHSYITRFLTSKADLLPLRNAVPSASSIQGRIFLDLLVGTSPSWYLTLMLLQAANAYLQAELGVHLYNWAFNNYTEWYSRSAQRLQLDIGASDIAISPWLKDLQPPMEVVEAQVLANQLSLGSICDNNSIATLAKVLSRTNVHYLVNVNLLEGYQLQLCSILAVNLLGDFYQMMIVEGSIRFPDSDCLATGLRFGLTFVQPVDNLTLAGTFMADAPTEDIFLFMVTPHATSDHVITVPALRDIYYWSTDPEGQSKLEPDLWHIYGLPEVIYTTAIVGCTFSRQEVKELRELLDLQTKLPPTLQQEPTYITSQHRIHESMMAQLTPDGCSEW
ncbi:hypothetical protein DFH09DRAFT_1093952 [Mycena vulgaris]|nr:hypothetical protein DFH09DRAFT_1093952 [Mycena vulgaris]